MRALARSAESAALALRLSFLLHAFRLDLLPAPLAGAVTSLAAASPSRLPECAGEVGARFAEARHALALDGIEWPDAPEASLTPAVEVALASGEAGAGPRDRAERLGRLCETLVHRNRRASGSYYTPGAVADEIARTVVRGVLVGRGVSPAAALALRVFDPAVGAGAFALAAIEAIAEAAGEGRSGETRRTAARDCIFATELSQLAADACRLAVWLAVSRPGRYATIPHDHINVAEALANPPARRSFDIVVGNPPWGVKLGAREAERIAASCPDALGGHRDSFLFFLHLAAECARDDGAVGLALPDTVLYQVRYEGMRRWLLDRFRPLQAAALVKSVFPGATAPACALCLVGKGIAQGADSLPAPHASWLRPPDWLVRLHGRLASTLPRLGDPALGFTFHDVGINYPRAEVGRAALYSGDRLHANDIPVARGRDFGPFTQTGNSVWLRHDWRERAAPGLSVRDDVYVATPKLLFRQTADRPIATIDTRGVHFGRSVIAIAASGERDLRWLCALLNSRAAAALYRAVAPEQGRAFAQVKVSKLKLLPLPVGGREELAQLAAALMGENELARRERLAGELDAAVYAAYGLSEEEVTQVEAMVESCSAVAARARRGRRGATS